MEILDIKSLSADALAERGVGHVELYFVDNLRGDDDLNLGSIEDPGIFALVETRAASVTPAPVDTTPIPIYAPPSTALPEVAFRVEISLPSAPDLVPKAPAFDSLLRPSEIAYSAFHSLERFSPGDAGRVVDETQRNYTSNIGWQAMVVPARDPNLTVFRGIGDQYSDRATPGTFIVPADAFVHTQNDAWVELTAEMVDGSALPKWLQFDSKTGVFRFVPPEKFVGELKIKLTAHDNAGREARTMFRFHVGERDAKIGGKPSFSDQLRAATKAAKNDVPAPLAEQPVSKGSREPAKPE